MAQETPPVIIIIGGHARSFGTVSEAIEHLRSAEPQSEAD